VTRRSWHAALCAALATLLVACGRSAPAYSLQDITGLMPDLAFKMTDQGGRPVSAVDYRGRIVLLYFGYTHCPDACPTELATLAQATHALGAAAARTQVLFVTVDPPRDTGALLREYLANFDPRFAGLRGDPAALDALTRRYRVSFHAEPPDRDGNYAVDHSSAVFIFDGRGRARLLASAADTAAAIAQDVHRLLTQS